MESITIRIQPLLNYFTSILRKPFIITLNHSVHLKLLINGSPKPSKLNNTKYC